MAFPAAVKLFVQFEGNRTDQSESDNHLVQTQGNPSYVADATPAGTDGQCIALDGSDGVYRASGDCTDLDATDEWGIGGWLRYDGGFPIAAKFVVGKCDQHMLMGNGGYYAYIAPWSPPNTIALYFRITINGANYAVSDKTLTIGTWHCWAIRVSRAGEWVKLYVDGALSDTDTTQDASPDADANSDFFVGFSSEESDYWFTGLMDELWVVQECPSEADITDIYTDGFESVYSSGALPTYTAVGRGQHAMLADMGTALGRGRFAGLADMGTGLGRGRYTVYTPIGPNFGRGRFGILQGFDSSGRGEHRIANDALARYELYRGVDGAPDLDAAPWETFESLPHVSAALDASHVYRFLTRLRNEYGLVSRNLDEWSVTVDADGNAEATPPSAPQEVGLEAAAAGTVLVTARYYYDLDGSNQADAFLIYLTNDGGDPDPEVDEATEVSMSKVDGTAKLDWTSEANDDEATVKVLVRTRRSGTPDVDSTNTAVLSTTAETDGPAAPAGNVFYPRILEQV